MRRRLLLLASAIGLLAFLAHCRQQPENTGEIETLTPGASLQRPLPKRTFDPFQLTLEAGDFVRIEVEQRGVDLGLRLNDQTAPVDYLIGEGVEWLSIKTAHPRSYWIEVHSFETIKDGDYSLRVVPLTDPTPADDLLLEAERVWRQGAKAFASGKRDDLLASRALYEKVLTTAQTLNHVDLQLSALYRLGKLSADLNDIEAAFAEYARMEALAVEKGRLFEEAIAVEQIAQAIFEYRGNADLALERFYHALFLFRKMGADYGEARVLASIAAIYQAKSEYQLALDLLNQAIPVLEANGQSENIGPAYNTLGTVYRELGDPDGAIEAFQRALPMLRAQTRNPYRLMLALLNLGAMYRDMEDYEQSLSYFQEALNSWHEGYNPVWRSLALKNIGSVHINMGEYDTAKEYLLRAAETDVPRFRAEALYELGRADYRKWEDNGALRRPATAEMENDLARATGNLQAALELDAKPLLKVNVLYLLAKIQHYNGHREYRALLDQAVDIMETQRDGLTSERNRASYFSRMLYLYELYVALLMADYRQAPNETLAADALGVFETAHARNLLEVLAKVSRGDRGKARGQEMLKLDDRLHRLKQAIADRRIDPTGQRQTVDVVPQSLEGLNRALEEALAQREALQSGADDWVEAEILSGRQIQELIAEPDTMAIECAVGKHRSFLWSVTTERIAAHELPGEERLRSLVDRIATALNRPPGERSQEAEAAAAQAMTELSDLLLGPLWPMADKRLAIVASGPLQLIPFGALPAPGTAFDAAALRSGRYQALIDVVDVVYLPSSSVLHRMRNELAARAKPPRQLALFYDPVFRPSDRRMTAAAAVRGGAPRDGFARLPATRREARAIRELPALANAGNVLIREGFAADKSGVLDPSLRDYRVLHFATHGYLDTEDPSRSSLVLSLYDRDGNEIDGFLSLAEIAKLELNPDLVVLSACETALGKELRGEGLISLARGFMFAGAPRVVATLWRVSDDSTARLMVDLYRGMLEEGETPAAALRAARLQLRALDSWSDPYYWGGFVFIGDWR